METPYFVKIRRCFFRKFLLGSCVRSVTPWVFLLCGKGGMIRWYILGVSFASNCDLLGFITHNYQSLNFFQAPLRKKNFPLLQFARKKNGTEPPNQLAKLPERHVDPHEKFHSYIPNHLCFIGTPNIAPSPRYVHPQQWGGLLWNQRIGHLPSEKNNEKMRNSWSLTVRPWKVTETQKLPSANLI